MTEITVPETPTEIAKRLWDTAIEHLEAAATETDPSIADCYVGIGELALKAAEFAVANPALLLGIPDDGDPSNFGLPAGAPPLPSHIQPGGMTGPRVWGR